jgi:hypothetical protein
MSHGEDFVCEYSRGHGILAIQGLQEQVGYKRQYWTWSVCLGSTAYFDHLTIYLSSKDNIIFLDYLKKF